MTTAFVLYLLFSVITIIIATTTAHKYDKRPPEKWTLQEWGLLTVVSFIPILHIWVAFTATQNEKKTANH